MRFHEFARRHGDFAVVAAVAALSVADGRVLDARFVPGGMGGAVVRSAEVEGLLHGGGAEPPASAIAAQAAAAGIDSLADLQGSPEYRHHLAGVLVWRALGDAVTDGR